MLDVFRQGRDMHAVTAANAWPEIYSDWTHVDKNGPHRKMAKVANFLSVYSGSAQTLYRGGNAPDLATAERVIEGIYKAFPTMVQWMQQQAALGLTRRHAKTAMGRKRFFNPIGPLPSGEDARRKWYQAKGEIKRAAANMPVQGTAADIAKKAIVLMDKRLPVEAHLVAFVHDEVVCEVREDLVDDVSRIIQDCMLEAGREMLGGRVETLIDLAIHDCWQK
jgi:DNA polymerase-1